MFGNFNLLLYGETISMKHDYVKLNRKDLIQLLDEVESLLEPARTQLFDEVKTSQREFVIYQLKKKQEEHKASFWARTFQKNRYFEFSEDDLIFIQNDFEKKGKQDHLAWKENITPSFYDFLMREDLEKMKDRYGVFRFCTIGHLVSDTSSFDKIFDRIRNNIEYYRNNIISLMRDEYCLSIDNEFFKFKNEKSFYVKKTTISKDIENILRDYKIG